MKKDERDMLIETVTQVREINKRLDKGEKKFDKLAEKIGTLNEEVTIIKTQKNALIVAAGAVGGLLMLIADSAIKWFWGTR